MAAGHVRREDVLPALEALLGGAPEAIQEADDYLDRVCLSDGAGVALVDIAHDQGILAGVRQLAALTLRRSVISRRWPLETPDADTGATPLHPEEKVAIRARLPAGLAEPSRLVRTAFALCIAKVGQYDWPEEWPGLMDALLHCVHGQNPDGSPLPAEVAPFVRDGAVRTLTYLSDHVGTDGIVHTADALVPVCLQFLGGLAEVPVGIRCGATTILRNVFETMKARAGLGDEEGRAVAERMREWIPQVTDVAAAQLRENRFSPPYERLKRLTLKLLAAFGTDFPTLLGGEGCRRVVELVMGFAREFAPIFVHVEVEGAELTGEQSSLGPVDAPDEMVDPDNEDGLDFLAAQVMVWMKSFACLPVKRLKKQFRGMLPASFELAAIYAQLRSDALAEWSEDMDQYIQDEHDDSVDASARQSVRDYIMEAVDMHGSHALRALTHVVRQWCLAPAGSGEAVHAWKVHEAGILMVGTVAASLISWWQAKGGEGEGGGERLAFSLPEWTDYLGAMVGAAGQHMELRFSSFDGHSGVLQREDAFDASSVRMGFLRGRALWCAARLSRGLPDELCLRFVEAGVEGLDPSQSPPVQMAACMALDRLCRRLEGEALGPCVPAMLERLARLLPHCSEIGLPVVMRTLVRVMRTSPESVARIVDDIAPLLIAVWLRFAHDPTIDSADALAALIGNPDPTVAGRVAERLAPTLISVLRHWHEQPGGFVAACLDLLRGLAERGPRPLPDSVLGSMQFVLHVMEHSDDGKLTQHGADTLASFVFAAPDSIIHGRHPETHRSYLDHIFSMLGHLLRWTPPEEEYGSLYAGRLASAVLTKLGSALEPAQLWQVLGAVVVRMYTAKLPALIVQMALVLADCLLEQRDETVSFLASPLPPRDALIEACQGGADNPVDAAMAHCGGVGEPALVALLRIWLDHSEYFMGSFSRKVLSMGLATIVSCRAAMDIIKSATVEVEMAVVEESHVMTRAQRARQGKQLRKVAIPMPVRISQVLARTLLGLQEEGDFMEGEQWEDSDEEGGDGFDEEAAAQFMYSELGAAGAPSVFVEADEVQLLTDLVGGGAMGGAAWLDFRNVVDGDEDEEAAMAADIDDEEETEMWAREHRVKEVNLEEFLAHFFHGMRFADDGEAQELWHATLQSLTQEGEQEQLDALTNPSEE